jgi:ferredoxin
MSNRSKQAPARARCVFNARRESPQGSAAQATGLDKSYQAHAQPIEQLEQMMHEQRDSCAPASDMPCAACAVSCPAHLCGSLALRSAALRGAEHRAVGQGVVHTLFCM